MKVKFELPIGALVNGWRHLGKGEFVADSERPVGQGFPPSLIEGIVSDAGDELAPVVLEPFVETLPGTVYRVVRVVEVSPRVYVVLSEAARS